ncbi:hypothetical protein [Nocardia amamiensis]|nr:hypothetical protein [Nocardia amamiensis]
MKQEPTETSRSGVVGIPAVHGREEVKAYKLRADRKRVLTERICAT